jgi:hypothetical protein
MGKVVKGEFIQNPGEDGDNLIHPIDMMDYLLPAKKNREGQQLPPYEHVKLLFPTKEQRYPAVINGNNLEIEAPLDWVDDINNIIGGESGVNDYEEFKLYALTTIYVKSKLNGYDSDRHTKHILNISIDKENKISFADDEIELEHELMREYQLWRIAAGISLRAITNSKDQDRENFVETVKSFFEEELYLQLKDLKYSPHKKRLKKLFNKTPQYFELDGYKLGCLNPIYKTQELMKISPLLMAVANR